METRNAKNHTKLIRVSVNSLEIGAYMLLSNFYRLCNFLSYEYVSLRVDNVKVKHILDKFEFMLKLGKNLICR